MGSCPDSRYIYANEQLREISELLCSVLLLRLSCVTMILALSQTVGGCPSPAVISVVLPQLRQSSVKQCNNPVKFTKFMQNSKKWQILFGTQLTN